METLNKVNPGKKVKVKQIIGSSALKHRIMDMGITKGIELLIKRTAPFGGPLEIMVRGYNISLGNNEAKQIIVEVQNKNNLISLNI